MAMTYIPEEALRSEIHVGPEASTAAVFYTDPNGYEYMAVGDAKKHPKDRNVPHIGANIAVARALIQLGYEIAKQTEHEVYR